MTSRRTRWTCIGTLALAGLLLAGCEKEVKLTFFNGTNEGRDLILSGPGDGTGHLGSLPAMGKLTTKIRVDEDWLPATYQWEAGDTAGSFTMTKETPGKLMIAIERGGSIGPIDKNTEVHKAEDIKVKDVIVDQDTVVE